METRNTDEVYTPIPDQLERLAEHPSLADRPTIQGFRELIRQGIEKGVFTAEKGNSLLEKLRFISALNSLEEDGIIT